jgi:hypothetical protein
MSNARNDNTRDDEARRRNQERRAASGKLPRSFGPGGNPEGVDDDEAEVEDEATPPTSGETAPPA